MDTINQDLKVHCTVSDNIVLRYTNTCMYWYAIILLVTYFIAKDNYTGKIS